MDDIVKNNKIKPQKKVNRFNKKWTKCEEEKLMEFLLENPDTEKPNAQSFYRRFSKETGVDADWKMSRSKIRYWREKYNKTKLWLNSNGTGCEARGTIKNSINKMCPEFDQLKAIFESKTNNDATKMDVTSMVVSPLIEYCPELPEEMCQSYTTTTSATTTNVSATTTNVSATTTSATNNRDIYSRKVLQELLRVKEKREQFQHMNLDLEEKKFHFEVEKFDKEESFRNKEIELKNKEIDFKNKEIELRNKEIDNNYQIKILEIESRERIAMKELKLKYMQK